MGICFAGINIIADDPVKSFAFYKGIGLEVKEEESPESKWYGATFYLTEDKDGPLLWIWRRQEDDDKDIKNMIVIGCEDIDGTYHELKAKGYDASVPELQFYGGKEMILFDPDGNRILFLD